MGVEQGASEMITKFKAQWQLIDVESKEVLCTHGEPFELNSTEMQFELGRYEYFPKSGLVSLAISKFFDILMDKFSIKS
jgi:hypothetical protein